MFHYKARYFIWFFISCRINRPSNFKVFNDKEFIKFKKLCSKSGTTEEALAQAEKIGYKTNLLAENPLDKNLKSQFISLFVLMDYGFGAVFWLSCP